MPRYKYNPDAQKKEAPSNRTSFISNVVPEDNRWTPGEGTHKIRILPPWSEEGLIAKKIQVYYKAGRDQLTFISPDFFEEETCPFIHAYKQIYKKIAGDKGGYDRHKDDIRNVRPVNRWYANVIVIDEISKGVQLWGFGKKAYEQIMNLYEIGEYGDVTDPDDGSILLLTLSPDTYGLTPTVHPARQSSPLANMEWLDQMYDLDNIWIRPDIEAVKKAYLTTPFHVWEPEYLYAQEDGVHPGKTMLDLAMEYDIPEAPASSTAVDDQHKAAPEEADDIPDFETPSSPVDEVTGAPTVPPEEVPPPSAAASAQAFDSAKSLEEKIKAKAAAAANQG